MPRKTKITYITMEKEIEPHEVYGVIYHLHHPSKGIVVGSTTDSLSERFGKQVWASTRPNGHHRLKTDPEAIAIKESKKDGTFHDWIMEEIDYIKKIGNSKRDLDKAEMELRDRETQAIGELKSLERKGLLSIPVLNRNKPVPFLQARRKNLSKASKRRLQKING